MKKVIIIGASSGICRELALIFAANGYEVGICARRTELLNEIAATSPLKMHTAVIDISDTDSAVLNLEKLIKDMGDVDIIIISAGTGHLNPSLDWLPEKETIDTNVHGFTAMAMAAMRYFINRKEGHLVGISSIAALRGSDICPAYNASKAYISSYLEGIRKKAAREQLKITVTDIQPGLVDTDMARGKNLFWLAPPRKAAQQIYRAICKKKKKAYITKRWTLIAWLFKILPDSLFNRI
jgi:short-subunit dehydrogenase